MCHGKTNTLQVMEYKQTDIKGVFIIEPRVFQDARGYFFEAWKDEEFQQKVGKIKFIQDNESRERSWMLPLIFARVVLPLENMSW